MGAQDILRELRAYDSVRRLYETSEDLISAICLMECRIKSYKEDAISELAQVSPAYKHKAIHKAEISNMARVRLIERYVKHSKKVDQEANDLFVERSKDL